MKKDIWRDTTQSILDQLYPTPQERIANPKNTEFGVNDTVESLIGSSKGQMGTVVVERNANYADKEWNVNDESIGVSFFEKRDLHPVMKKIVTAIDEDEEGQFETVVRWFDNSKQLKLVKKAGK